MYKLESRPYSIEDGVIIFKDKNFCERTLPQIGQGSKSDVYKFRVDGKFYALKIFNSLYSPDIENFKRKMKIDIPSYVQPLMLSYFRDTFNGYLMLLCNGKDLEKRKLDITLEEFYRSFLALSSDTDKLTESGYTIYDAFISNIMYDNGFKMIDIDDYPFGEQDREKLNEIRLNRSLLDIFLKTTRLGLLFVDVVELTKLKSLCESGSITFQEFYEIILSKILNDVDPDVTKLPELGKVLSKKYRNY